MDLARRAYPTGDIGRLATTKPAEFWERERALRLIRFFRTAARKVPAYRDFLKKNRVDPEKIRTPGDLASVPPVTKKNYLRAYPLDKLVWPETLQRGVSVITSTSGSTGEPSYFIRNEQLDWAGSLVHQMFLQQSSRGAAGPTLVVMGFSMGVWIAGLYTYKCFELAAERGGYNLSIITPGINKHEILGALRRLGPHFRQTILAGYPPFVKDILDEASAHGIDLSKLGLRLLFAAEPFSEGFRDHVARKANLRNIHLDTLNIYGTAEMGAMAFETPLSILLRREAVSRNWTREIFPEAAKLPTFAQYNPALIHFEAVEGNILLTGDNSIPLIRYAIGDRGGVYGYDELMAKMGAFGWRAEPAIRASGITPHLTRLPFVYVYERDDFSTTLYGLQVYPETIREALLHKSFADLLTGKFTMLTKFDRKHDQHLEVNLEVQKNRTVSPSAARRIGQAIFDHLRKKNSEFRELSNHLKKRAEPRLVFWPAEDPLHFKPGIKQKWAKK